MGSKDKQTRQNQKDHFQHMIEQRKALLTHKGIDEEHLQKDKVLKHLQAGLERTIRAIARINSREKVIQNVRLQKQKKAEKTAAAEKTEG